MHKVVVISHSLKKIMQYYSSEWLWLMELEEPGEVQEELVTQEEVVVEEWRRWWRRRWRRWSRRRWWRRWGWTASAIAANFYANIIIITIAVIF